ncbi:MAG TPA: arylamine N-acetyltransferase [Ktedonobacteraceae bacterium]|nr:arylamine N-acetyltransferase [Ktedonobacteraceae bacterium]
MNIHDYLQRIRYRGSLEPTLETLRTLHEAHLLTVPFENLSIHLGQPVLLREEALYEKIVQRRRGGFCYELNGLFAWLLRQLGFQVSLLSASVAREQGGFNPPFDHLTLLLHGLDGANWLADVGFGDSFRRPLCLQADLEQRESDGQAYRLTQEDSAEAEEADYWFMQRLGEQGWEAQYRFTLQPYALADFTQRCRFHQTSPDSHFTQKRVCSLATPQGRITLSDWQLITTTQGERTERPLSSQEEYSAVLADSFGVVI